VKRGIPKNLITRSVASALTSGSLIWSISAWAGTAEELKSKRCATRLSIALLGTSPTDGLLSDPNPQSQVDQILAKPEFQERFARFINSQLNDEPGAMPIEDAAYHMSKYIMANNKPWKEMFLGQYNLVATGTGAAQTVAVNPDPNGLGYFRNREWMVRYAGNELAGIRLTTTFRVMQNVTGLHIAAAVVAPGANNTASGRSQAPCKACHFENWYALDLNSKVFGTVTRVGNQPPTFNPPSGESFPVLGGLQAKDDKEFVTHLVNSSNFSVNACRLAFQYLYGRHENACEHAVFDACVDAFNASGMISSALSSVAKDPTFCQ